MSILIKNPDYVLTSSGVVENENVLIEDDRIGGLGTTDRADKLIDATNKAVIPGLANLHTHSSMNLLRGVSDDRKLEEFLREDIWPREEKITEERAYWGSMLAFLEMLKTGTTCFNDMYFHTESIAEAAEDIGIRGYIGYGMIDVGKDNTTEEELRGARETVNRVQKFSDRLRPTLTPHSVSTCSDELLLKSKDLADRHGTVLHMHLSEIEDEVKNTLKEKGKRPVEHLDSLDLLDEGFVGAHAVHLDRNEIEILSETNASVVYNPCSNMKLGSGVAPIKKMLDRKLNVCIGTDGAATNNNLDLLEELKVGSLLQKVQNSDPTVLPHNETVKLPTVNAARAMGGDFGEIKKGAPADLVLVDLKDTKMKPTHSLTSNLVYSGARVDTVLVDGDIVLRNGKPTKIDEEEVYRKAQEAAERIA